MAKTIVHLVHGTWPYGPIAHRVPWLRRHKVTWFHVDSPFCLALKSALPTDVTLRPFEWSGDNSYLARHDAAAALAMRLYQCYDQEDPPQQILVAHSHGGNVALLAAMHPRSPPLAGIATLAAPFLHVERRTKDERQQRFLGYVQRAAMVLVGGSVLSAFLARVNLLDADTSGAGLVAFAGANVMVLLLLLGLLWYMAGVAQQMVEKRAAVDKAPLWAFPRIAPWLILRAPGDEAAAVLKGARLANRTLEFVWTRLRSLLDFMTPALRHRWFMLLLLLAFIGVSSAIQPIARVLFLDESWHAAWRHVVPVRWLPAGLPFEAGAAVAAAGFAVLLILGALLFLAGALLAPFGWELVTMGLAFEVTAVATPPGDNYSCVILTPGWSGLRHSLHESSEGRTRLAEWIARLPPAATGPGSRYWKIRDRS